VLHFYFRQSGKESNAFVLHFYFRQSGKQSNAFVLHFFFHLFQKVGSTFVSTFLKSGKLSGEKSDESANGVDNLDANSGPLRFAFIADRIVTHGR